jgi:hypothetical protein
MGCIFFGSFRRSVRRAFKLLPGILEVRFQIPARRPATVADVFRGFVSTSRQTRGTTLNYAQPLPSTFFQSRDSLILSLDGI